MGNGAIVGIDARGWFSLTSAAITAAVVGFASTILLIMEAARAVGATPAEQASWAAALCYGMAVTTLILSYLHRIPIITAWSTPGAALIATSAAGIGYREAIGAFLVAGSLMCLTALIKPLERAIERIPAPIAAAMLAGVLLRYCLGVPGAALEMPAYVLLLVALFFVLRLVSPVFAVPVIVAIGIAAALFTGQLAQDCCTLSVTSLRWTPPKFDAAAILSLGIPLFLVTMASQNLPGFAVIKAAGYAPPVSSSLGVTGVASLLLAPFGSHALNLAAITASIATGPDCHPDPGKRWLVALPYFVVYALVGIFAASFIGVLGALPKPLIVTIAGLALFGPLMGAAGTMFKEPRDIESALLTFLVTASGVSFPIWLASFASGLLDKDIVVGSAFWGLVAGLVLYAARHSITARRPWRRS
jgi:benzoate membrane transport protein